MHRQNQRLVRTFACAAVALPVLLVAGCSDSGSGESASTPTASEGEASPTPAEVKYKTLPDACKTISKNTVEDMTPKTENAGGKRIGTGDASRSGSCLWSGLDKFDYRQLTVSLKRFDSDASRGTGDKLAGEYLDQQVQDLKTDKSNKDVKAAPAKGLGDEATSVRYDLEKKDGDSSEDFREQRTLVRSANVVVVVDYEGAGFEDGKLPTADDLEKKAEKAAQEAVAALKKA